VTLYLWLRGIKDDTLKKYLLLGMPTLIELGSLEENIDFCHSLGFNLLEMNMNLPYLQIGELKKINLPRDLNFSIHLPEELNVWDFNPKIRKAYLETLMETIKFAESNNINILNMHMNRGVYFTLPHKKIYLFEQNMDFFREKTEEFGSIINDLLKDSEIRIHLENTGILNLPFIRDAVSWLLNSQSFSLTWDVGHDWSSGNRDLEFYKYHSMKIKHMHLHDAIGHRNHLPLGEGDLEVNEIFDIAGDSVNSIILETKTCEGLRKSVDYFRGLNSGSDSIH
jgi:sugar phosphate isomerase/epimerase